MILHQLHELRGLKDDMVRANGPWEAAVTFWRGCLIEFPNTHWLVSRWINGIDSLLSSMLGKGTRYVQSRDLC